MTNNTNSEKVVVSGKVVDDVAIVVEAEDLYLPPMIRIKNQEGENLVEFPMEYLTLINKNYHDLTVGLYQQQTTLKKARGNPDGRYDFIEMSDEVGNEFIVTGTNRNEEGTPYLKWSSDREEDTRRNLQAQEAGWRIYLKGADDIAVQFARWDDAEGIDRLVNGLRNKRTIAITLAFINPASTAKLTSRKAVTDLKKSRKLPAVKMTAIRKMIITNGLATKEGNWRDGTLTSLFIKVGEIKVPVAIRVDSSNYTSWAKKMTKEEEQLPYGQRNVIQTQLVKENKEEWIRRFKVALISDMPKWRIVSIPNREYKNNSYREPEGLWVTNVLPEIWNTIAPAAHDTVKSESLRGSRF